MGCGSACSVVLWIVLFAFMASAVFSIVQASQEKRRRIAAEAAARAAEEAARLRRYNEEQQAYYEQMIVLGEQSVVLFESMPTYLSTAEKHMDQAEACFAEGVFAPFWDSIENAAKALGRFSEAIRQIKDNLSRYTGLTKKYEATAPEFPLSHQSVEKLCVGTETAERMKAIVWKAQHNFQFASIYEQRKTNQILVAGFTNLAEALGQMTFRITASIDELATTLNESSQALHARTGDVVEAIMQHQEGHSKALSEGAEREKKVMKMLDNIQRDRKPFL